MQSNIRYNGAKGFREPYVFHDFDDENEQPVSPKMASQMSNFVAERLSPGLSQNGWSATKTERVPAKSTLNVDESLEIIHDADERDEEDIMHDFMESGDE